MRILVAVAIVVCVATPSEAAFALVAERADQLGVNGGTSGSQDTTGATLITLGVATDAGVTLVSGDITDSKSNTGYVLHGTYTIGLSRIHLFSKASPTVGSGHTVTVTKTSSFASVAFAAFSGGSAFDDEDGGTATGGSVSPATGITPSQNDALVVSAVANYSVGGVATGPAGYSTPIDSGFTGGTTYAVAFAYDIQTTATATDPLWQMAAGSDLAVIVASFLAGGGGGTTPKLLTLGVGPLLAQAVERVAWPVAAPPSHHMEPIRR